jgi:hypothetical protein
MTERAQALADKLMAEGERMLAAFRELPASAWQLTVYGEGPAWKVRDVFEHLILSEQSLLRLYQRIVESGEGIAEGFSTDQFNAEHTGELAALSRDEILHCYTQTRQLTVDFTHALSDAQLAIRARHPALGMAALEDMLKLIYLHHTMHLRDIRRQMRA